MLLILAAPGALARELKVLVMGDSLSAAYGLRAEQGWVALADAKSGRYAFHNASISGETSAGGRSRIGAELERVRPDIVIIELGANDGLRGLPLQQLGANLGWMIGASKAAGARVLLVGMQLPPNFGRYASDFERSYLLISQRLQTGLLPRFLAPLGTERKWFQADNLHPVAEAQPLLAAQVLQALDGLPPPR
ncbi:MAG TPA: arylesterase [Thermomonas sp.]|uniref:arylesterase n=1 Tax=Thermomonas sp. TaxID=1971895 RepID=UPI0025F9B371|nr:arylesterase [Thermomonas sp.]HQW59625.1 arylesterase [Thermomonas sp.]HQX94461.1 arylesterase [Thermomonas sp.]